MIGFLATVLGFYVLLVGGLYLFQRNLMYFPDRSRPDLVRAGLDGIRELTVETQDGLRLTSWYRGAASGKPCIVFFQGNAGNIEHRAFKVRVFIGAGYGVMLVGYRGYGGNPGEPSEEGLYADARAALSALEKEGVEPRRMVLYGESLGTGVAVRMAAERAALAPVAAVVLEAPFTSAVDAAGHYYPYVPVSLILKDRFDSALSIAGIGAPLLVFHGENDRTMPIRFAKALYDQAGQPKEAFWVPGAGHNNLYDFGVAREIIAFIARHTLSKGS